MLYPEGSNFLVETIVVLVGRGVLGKGFSRKFPRGGGGTRVNFCWVCAAGFSEPLPQCYSLFCGQL